MSEEPTPNGNGSTGPVSHSAASDWEELAAWQPETEIAEVRIGHKTFRVQGILDGRRLTRLFEQSQARAKQIFQDGEGKPIRLSDAEASAYVFLIAGLVDEPRPGFEQIVAISGKTGMDCLMAGQRVMELSGLSDEAVDEKKGPTGTPETTSS